LEEIKPDVATGGPRGERKPTRREVFLQLMEQVIPWDLLIKAIEPYYPKAGPQGGRPAYPAAHLFFAERVWVCGLIDGRSLV